MLLLTQRVLCSGLGLLIANGAKIEKISEVVKKKFDLAKRLTIVIIYNFYL